MLLLFVIQGAKPLFATEVVVPYKSFVEVRLELLELELSSFAQSLHERAYEHNPGFRRFMEESGLCFRAHAEFKKADLDARQELYCKLAEQIWNPENLLR